MIALALFCTIFSYMHAQAQPMKIMTYNIRCGNCDNNNENNWESRKNITFSMIDKYKPDIIGFQEIIPFQLAYISDTLKEYSYFGSGRDANRGGEGCYIFYNKEKFTIDSANSGTLWYSDTPEVPGSSNWGDDYQRIITYARFTDKKTGKSFYHFNTHLTLKDSIQSRYAEFLAQNITKRAIADPVIVTGDFNAIESSKAIERMKQPIGNLSLIDSYREVHPTGDAFTFHGFTGKGDGRKIDYIFIQKDSFKVVDSDIITYNVNNKFPSDHFPILVELLLK
jgi:endonuclease/exonuclease/phosphatase family metal-dependent hydrolase